MDLKPPGVVPGFTSENKAFSFEPTDHLGHGALVSERQGGQLVERQTIF